MHFTSSSHAPHDHHTHIPLTPADILFLSAADTDLIITDLAYQNLSLSHPTLPSLASLNLMDFSDEHEVDHLITSLLPKARFIIARILGGKSYWSYGIDALHLACQEQSLPLALLSGDDKNLNDHDKNLFEKSLIPKDLWHNLSLYAREGGTQNMQHFLAHITQHIQHPLYSPIPPPSPIAPSGHYPHNLTPHKNAPSVLILFYRAWMLSGQTDPIDHLIHTLHNLHINPLPVHITSLRDPASHAFIHNIIEKEKPLVTLTTTGFSAGKNSPLASFNGPILQVLTGSQSQEEWLANPHGVDPKTITMQVAMPEIDGHILSHIIASKEQKSSKTNPQLKTMQPLKDQCQKLAHLTLSLIRNRQTPNPQRRVALIMAHYPSRDSRMANGVGLDTPNSLFHMLHTMVANGYTLNKHHIPPNARKLIALFQGKQPHAQQKMPLDTYKKLASSHIHPTLLSASEERWGPPEKDPSFSKKDQAFLLPFLHLGNAVIGLQPSRGYHLDPHETYHDPALVPPHAYIAFYLFIRYVFSSHVLVHFGKHGNLEWLPGKAVALSHTCWPQALIGDTPHVYPFIVNDPGEGAQAKRRTHAVIVDHLTPPLERAEQHGVYAELETLLDELFHASTMDGQRAHILEHKILDLAHASGLDKECHFNTTTPDTHIHKVDAYLCTLKEMQIRTGLHIFARSPSPHARDHLLLAIARSGRGSLPRDTSLLRAIASDFNLGESFDPLAPITATSWNGPRPPLLLQQNTSPWRHDGDTIERLEQLALSLIKGTLPPEKVGDTTTLVMHHLKTTIFPALDNSAPQEEQNFLRAIAGHPLPPGPAGAPTRGKPEVLPTGKNFFSLDPRIMPTLTAWELGKKSAHILLERYHHTHGSYPRNLALSAWGTSNMRTGGDDVAQMLALIGVEPSWDASSQRVEGFTITPLDTLARPRVDVTLRISGFFRDAFPHLITLIDEAVRAVASLKDEPHHLNPLAHTSSQDTQNLETEGFSPHEASWLASSRIFGSRPGAYGAGLQTLIDADAWESVHDLAKAFLSWSSYIYSSPSSVPAPLRQHQAHYGHHHPSSLSRRLSSVQLVVHNQDNREHDILDSDDYYQFEGGLAASIHSLSGQNPDIYHMDHSRPDHPQAFTLKEEIGKVVRARVTNPKWIDAMRQHGHKGGFEMAATVTYLVAFAATTSQVDNSHFDRVFEAFIGNKDVTDFLLENNPDALREICEKLLLALDRNLWTTRHNHARTTLEEKLT